MQAGTKPRCLLFALYAREATRALASCNCTHYMTSVKPSRIGSNEHDHPTEHGILAFQKPASFVRGQRNLAESPVLLQRQL